MKKNRQLNKIVTGLMTTLTCLIFNFNSAICNESLTLTMDLELSAADSSTLPVISHATDAVIDSNGQIFVSDASLHCIHKFNPSGDYLGSMGMQGDGPGDIMFGVVLAIDSSDHLYIAGMGGRVDIMDSEWNFIDSFDRNNPSNMARSIGVASDGTTYISALNVFDQTTIDKYDKYHTYIASFSNTFASSQDTDWRRESFYAGGFLCVTANGNIIYSQLAPYDIREFSSDGTLIKSSSNGGDHFVPPPPEINFHEQDYEVTYPSASTAITALNAGIIATSSYRKNIDGSTSSLICCYDSSLNLLGSIEMDGTHSILGADSDGHIFIFSKSDTILRVARYSIEYSSIN